MPKARPTPPCPDPLRYVLVKTKEGNYWRLKRGTLKPAPVNSFMQDRATHNGSREAKQICDCLLPYLENMDAGRKIARMGVLLRRARANNGVFDFSCFKGFDVQKLHTLEMILREDFVLSVEKGMLYIKIPIRKFTVKPPVNYVTHFQLEAILMYGNSAKKGSLRTESDTSPMYLIGNSTESLCTLTLQLPEKLPWMVLLKVGTHEGAYLGHYDKLYGMQVVETSFDIAGGK
jgi:hypothetical protein